MSGIALNWFTLGFAERRGFDPVFAGLRLGPCSGATVKLHPSDGLFWRRITCSPKVVQKRPVTSELREVPGRTKSRSKI